MSVEIKVPVLPESVADATIVTWHKKPGEPVSRDENLVDIETDKVVLEVVAPDDGSLSEILKQEGELVTAEEVIAAFNPGSAASPTTAESEAPKPEVSKPEPEKVVPIAQPMSQPQQTNSNLSPAVRREVASSDLDVSSIQGSGRGGKITKDDLKQLSGGTGIPGSTVKTMGARSEERVPMTRLRARIAERLLQSQQNAAILTTFNEVNMQPIMDLRSEYKDAFEKRYGIRLGFMSFFVLATIEALRRFPLVNASIDGNDIVYHGYYDIGIAVSSPRGLVVPILRNAENMSMAEIEGSIKDYGIKAKDGKLTIEEMTGGTFTISNGGVFGSLMSTPIINPPQSGILGMHKTELRPVVEDGKVVVRPMMYIALSYDHRIIDGKESVQFLVTIKDMLENPARLLLGV